MFRSLSFFQRFNHLENDDFAHIALFQTDDDRDAQVLTCTRQNKIRAKKRLFLEESVGRRRRR